MHPPFNVLLSNYFPLPIPTVFPILPKPRFTQSIKLQWLQNCALAIDPTEAKIRVHLPVVLAQLRSALTAAVPTIAARGGPDLGVIRMTAHVVNSLALTAGATQQAHGAAAGGVEGGGAGAGGGGGSSGVQ